MNRSSRVRKGQTPLSEGSSASNPVMNRSVQRRDEHQPDTAEPPDLFSAFIFDPADPTATPNIAGANEQPQTSVSEMVVDDIFGDFDPQQSYRDEDLDFLNFLNPTKELSNFPRSTDSAIALSQDPFVQDSATNINNFPSPINTETHRSIIIPANITPSPASQPGSLSPIAPTSIVTPRPSLRPSPSRPVSHPSVASLPSSAFEQFSFNSPLLPTAQHPPSATVTPQQVQNDPFSEWTFDGRTTLEDLDLSPFSEGTPTTAEFPALQPSKPASPTIAINRRKSSIGTPTTEASNPFLKPTKTSHNMIEKRYRLKLNDKILALRNAVPALRTDQKSPEGETSNEPSKGGPSSKLNKGTVLAKATEYIKQLERDKRTLEEEVAALKEQLAQTRKEQHQQQSSLDQDFELGGVAPIALDANCLMTHDYDERRFIVPVNGMISPESCTSMMSPEAEGSFYVDALPKLRPKKRVRIEMSSLSI